VPAFPLLVLEAATTVGSVALMRNEHDVSSRMVPMGASREDAMLPAVDDLCTAASLSAGDIRTVVCGAGPGSFTSLRIAASIAKGIVHANRMLHGEDAAELYAVPSLLFAAAALDAPGEYLVHSDAMRGERFVQHVRITNNGIVEAVGETYRTTAVALGEALAADTTGMVTRVGVGTTAAGLEHDQLLTPTAARLFRIHAWSNPGPVDLHSWEPTYGRLAEAQVKWEALHGTPLPATS
jgi:tRNA threonylcarbamoyladenosine biosynthesis protein TsaB